MPRKVTFEIDIADDGELNIKTTSEGKFSLLEMFGIVRLLDNAVVDKHNKDIDELMFKSDKKPNP